MWISFGGFHEKTSEGDRIHNTHLIVNPEGEVAKIYTKVCGEK